LTANEDSNDVSIVDLESDAATKIPLGGAPRKIAVQSSQAEQSSSNRQISISDSHFPHRYLKWAQAKRKRSADDGVHTDRA
jgi:YVTN family beta-propeller protein